MSHQWSTLKDQMLPERQERIEARVRRELREMRITAFFEGVRKLSSFDIIVWDVLLILGTIAAYLDLGATVLFGLMLVWQTALMIGKAVSQ
jgi:hypothetical protein